LDKRRIIIEDARQRPEARMGTLVGEVAPTNIVVVPIPFEGEIKGALELGSVGRFSAIHLTFLDQLAETIGIVMNTITSTSRTERLLSQSLTMSHELQSRQEQLENTNTELEERSRLLSEQKKEVETKNREIEVARKAIEEK